MRDGFDAEHHGLRRTCLLFHNGKNISVSLFWWDNPESRFEQHMFEKSIGCSSGIKWAVPYSLGFRRVKEHGHCWLQGYTFRHGKREVVNDDDHPRTNYPRSEDRAVKVTYQKSSAVSVGMLTGGWGVKFQIEVKTPF